MLLCYGPHRRPLRMSSARQYSAEEIERNASRLLSNKVPLFVRVEGRNVHIRSHEELCIVARILSVYHAQIGVGAEAHDVYVDAAESLDAVWGDLGDDEEEPAPPPVKSCVSPPVGTPARDRDGSPCVPLRT